MEPPLAAVQEKPPAEPAGFLIDEADVPAFRAALAELSQAGYSEAGVRQRLGLSDLADLRWKSLPLYQDERLTGRDALALAIELFLLQGSVSIAEFARSFSESSLEALRRAEILSLDGAGFLRARASLYPVGDRLIFSDHAWHKLPHPGYTVVPSDQVMFVGSDSRWLARATVRKPVRRCLDLCTGSGVQALLAAPHSQRVLAVDINPRAARCARFNALASDAVNVEVVVGDLYDAVAAREPFDLILANPPFVPSPVDELTFRDGGRSGEEVQQRIVAGLPHHLAAGGIAQMVTELGEREGEPLAGRVRRWLHGAPVDIFILRLRAHTAEDYAAGHASGDGDFGAYLESVRAWARNLKAHGYARVAAVLIAFQWSDPALGAPFDRVDDAEPPRGNAGNDVESAFWWERAVRREPCGQAPGTCRVSRAGPVALTESYVLGSEIRAPSRATLLGRGLSVEQPLDPVETWLLRALDSTKELAELSRLARELRIEDKTILAAIDSLRRRGLITIAQ